MGQIREAIEAASRLEVSTDGYENYLYKSQADYNALHKGKTAPDMALFIQEALPWLELLRKEYMAAHIADLDEAGSIIDLEYLIARAK